jgi:formamidopyrimidine-DNA glycosylase
MAELPDLTVFAQILSRRFKGKTLETLEVSVAKKINVAAKELKKALEGRELTAVERVGKTLQLSFTGSQVLGLHLMLRGELVLIDQDEPPRFQILGFHFEGGEAFALIDMQKQATPTLNPEKVDVPDALAMDINYFIMLLAKKKTVIKTLLMDQQKIRGIGNSYSDEILYHAGISPFSIARSIPEKAVKKLFKSISSVLEKAIKEISEENGDELRGELRDFMVIHNPVLKETAKGEIIKTEKIGGRKTYYSDKQALFE